MNMTRWLMVAALGVLSCTWAQADSVPPDDGHYLIDLESMGRRPGLQLHAQPGGTPTGH